MNFTRHLLNILISLSLLSLPMIGSDKVSVVNNDEAYKKSIERLDRYMLLVKELRENLDRSQFDLSALLEKLDYDDKKIIDFVVNKIYFESYVGLLRGAKGTLMSQAGNAMDQSILLASLLNDAGYEARIVRTTLKEGQAKELLLKLGLEREKRSLGNLKNFKKILSKMAKLINIPADKIELFIEDTMKTPKMEDTEEYKFALKDKDFILKQLKKSNLDLKPLDITPQLLAEAVDYFWVQYRLSDSSKWKSIHPIVGQNLKFKNLKINEIFIKNIPENLQHRFDLNVVLEQKLGNSITTKKIISNWNKPAASLNGKTIIFSSIPSSMKSIEDIINPSIFNKTTNFIIPNLTIDGKDTLKLNMFDMDGILIDRDAGSNMASGLFQTMGKKMETAFGSMTNIATEDNNASSKNVRTLSGVWIDITQISPDGTEKKTRRYMIDRIGAENRKNKNYKINSYKNEEEALAKLTSTYKFMLTTGNYPQSYMLDIYFEKVQSSIPLLKYTILKSFYPNNTLELTLKHIKDLKDISQMIIANTFDKLHNNKIGKMYYHSEPSLFIMYNGLILDRDKVKSISMVDILNNSLRVLDIKERKVYTNPLNNLLYGTWVTRVEKNNASKNSNSENIWNTQKIFDEAEKEGISTIVLTSKEKNRLDEISNLPYETKKAITKDLLNGYTVVLPQKAINNIKHFAWWRVDVTTGESLGLIDRGFGATTIEYIIAVNVVALFVMALMTIPSYVDCKTKVQKSTQKMCSPLGCLKGAGIGMLLGGAIGYSAGLILTALIPSTLIAGGATSGALAVYGVETLSEGLLILYQMGFNAGLLISQSTNAIPSPPNCIE